MQNQEIKINQGLVDSLLKSNFERADFLIQHLGESYGADYMVIDFNLIELFARLDTKIVEQQFVMLESEKGSQYKDYFVNVLIDYIQQINAPKKVNYAV